MLKNTREYLIHELREVVNTIKESQVKIEDMKAKRAEAEELLNAYDKCSTTKSDIFTKGSMDLIMCAFFAFFAILFSVFIIPSTFIYVSALVLMSVSYTIRRIMDIKKYKEAKKIYYDIRSNLKHINPDDYENMSKLKYELCSKLQKIIENCENSIVNVNKECLQALWDTLSSDDFVDRLVHYTNNGLSEEIKVALAQEWFAYVDEISKEEPSKIHFASSMPSDYQYKSLKISHHPLAIYQSNDVSYK